MASRLGVANSFMLRRALPAYFVILLPALSLLKIRQFSLVNTSNRLILKTFHKMFYCTHWYFYFIIIWDKLYLMYSVLHANNTPRAPITMPGIMLIDTPLQPLLGSPLLGTPHWAKHLLYGHLTGVCLHPVPFISGHFHQ